MTEEEYFRKHYPDFCYGDKPLSPYWDFFQDGVEFGERQSEKKIEDLENQNRLLGERCNQLLKDKGDLTDKVKSLEEQIVDLKDYVLKVSKFLHNNNNVRPDKLVYKERDILLIKELKLFEKWELEEND